MSDLIERWKVLNAIDSIETEIEDGYGFQYEKWKEHFVKIPSVEPSYSCSHEKDAQPRMKGKWIAQNPFVDTEECSVCGYNIQGAEMETPFCPWCGACMSEGEEDE